MRNIVPKEFSLTSSLLMPQTIADAVARHAAYGPDRPAIVGTGFAPFSFRGLDFFIRQTGEHLRAAGIGRRSRVGIMLPRGPEGALLVVAVASHAISVPLNPNRPEAELEEELGRVRLDALVLPSWVDSPASAVARRSSFGLFDASPAEGSLAQVTLRKVREMPISKGSEKIPGDSVALIFTTSGTTGTPKLIPVTHENLLVTAGKMRQWFNLSPEDRTAFVLPGHYGAAIKLSLLAPLLLGGSVCLPATGKGEDLTEWVPELCPTWLWGNPTFFQAVLDLLRSRARPNFTHTLRFVVSGTAYLPPKLHTELEAALAIPVLQSYGMSEAGILAADPAPPRKRKPGTTGLISRGELSIVGQNGAPLPDGESGEIVVHGRTVSPDINAETEGHRSSDRRLFTGDLGFIDSDGYLTIVGRTKELINRGGEKISPFEVERALLLHPSVEEAAAYSVPHPRLGENVSAAVVMRSGMTATTQEFKTFLSNHLSAFKIPQNIHVVEDLPKGPTGKLSRSELSTSMAHRIRHMSSPESPLEFQIIEIWQTLLRRNDIGIDDDFFELGGDSLLAVQMAVEIEAIARRKITPSSLRTIYTIRQLAGMIAQTADPSEEFVNCAKEGEGTPFFFCHGDFATHGLWALRLVDMLKCKKPVFLVSPHPNPAPEFSIEEMARSRLPRILALQRKGPFRLGGFCNGGLLAWELAHQLEMLGHTVEFVVLINTRSLNGRLEIRTIARIARFIAAIAPRNIGEKIKLDAMRALWNRIKREIFYGPYLRAMANYLPPKLRGDVVVILCDEDRKLMEFSPTAWTRLVPKVYCRYVAGTHLRAITTHAGEVALVLDSLLSHSQTSKPQLMELGVLSSDLSRS
jgi:acyl-CoA synthetase (AMP-forming)/AMP-acid ligase II/thioesterase domain-containing protein/acyl carrier protein